MQRFGWTISVLIDENSMIIAGHARVLAAKSLGYTKAPVVVARGWTEDEKMACVMADNQLALNAGWDTSMLSLEIGHLGDAGFDISLLGFSDEQLKDLVSHREAEPTMGRQTRTRSGETAMLAYAAISMARSRGSR